ncbi:MAG: hypothetical protein SOR93_09670 [Clostridiales Family XIII bacterium]|nr:hypothetical protein [Clostridia bacterium]MDY3011502.1 hypothetical protein [Clostridiales Family XIII bacterium]
MEKTKALEQRLTRRTRAKAIRAKCLDCCQDQRAEVKACPIKKCPLWIYRMGYEVGFNGERIKRDDEEVK